MINTSDKTTILDAVMRDKNLSALMAEALEAKPGSTKRQKASNVLKSLKNVKFNAQQQDGMGGVGDGVSYGDQGSTGLQRPKLRDLGSMIKSDPMNLAGGQPQQQTDLNVGQVGPTGQLGSTTILPAAPKRNASYDPMASVLGGEQQSNTFNSIWGMGELTMGQEDGALTSGSPSPYQAVAPFQMVGEDGTFGLSVPGTKTPEQIRSENRIAQRQQRGITTPDTSQGVTTDPTPLIGPQAQPGASVEDLSTGYRQYYDDMFSRLSSADQVRWKTLYDSVDSGIGASTFAFMTMANTDELKKMFPNIPEAALPKGALLSEQLGDLKDTLYMDSGLKKMMSNLNLKQKAGATLQTDLKDYVRGRDEYGKKVDKMLIDAKDRMSKMDMANPYVKDSMTKYTNYLSILKGRQEKRYVDYINDSIDQHNTDLQFMTNQYNTQYNEYKDNLAYGTAVTTETYNGMKTMLGELYNNLAGIENTEMDMTIKQNEALISNYKVIAAAAEAYNIDSLEGIDSQEQKAYDRLLEGLEPIKNIKDGTVQDYKMGSLYDAMDSAELDGYSSERVKRQYYTKLNNLGISYGKTGQYVGFTKDINSQIDNIANSNRDTETKISDATKMAAGAINGVVDGLGRYFDDNEEIIPTVRAIMQDMTGWRDKPKYDVDEKSKFLKNNNNRGLDGNLLGFLFDNYVKHAEALKGGLKMSELYDLSKNDSGLSAEILYYMDNDLKYNAMSKIYNIGSEE